MALTGKWAFMYFWPNFSFFTASFYIRMRYRESKAMWKEPGMNEEFKICSTFI